MRILRDHSQQAEMRALFRCNDVNKSTSVYMTQ